MRGRSDAVWRSANEPGIEALDALPAELRAIVIERAKLRTSPRAFGVTFLIIGVTVLVSVGLANLFSLIWGDSVPLMASYLYAGVPILGAVLILHTRDMRWRMRLLDQLRRVSCPACGTTLMGASRSADAVRCGGCRAVYRYEELAVIPEDLGPPMVRLTAATRCHDCGYTLLGLPIDGGRIQCPECGRAETVYQRGEPA